MNKPILLFCPKATIYKKKTLYNGIKIPYNFNICNWLVQAKSVTFFGRKYIKEDDFDGFLEEIRFMLCWLVPVGNRCCVNRILHNRPGDWRAKEKGKVGKAG